MPIGMVSTGTWSGNELRDSYDSILWRLYPQSDIPLTTYLARGKKRKQDNAEYRYWSKTAQTQCGALTGKYEESTLTTAYGAGDTAAAGAEVHCKVAAATVAHFRVGHVAALVCSTNLTQQVFGIVTAVSTNGANSRISLRLLKAATAGYIYNADYIDIIGDANAEGAARPDSLTYAATELSNYTQIFRQAVLMSRTQMRTPLEYGDAYQEERAEQQYYHAQQREMAAYFGEKTKTTDPATGKPLRTTQGAVPFLVEHASDNCFNYVTESELSWLQGGDGWLDEKLEVLFRYGGQERLAICGSGCLLGIDQLVKQNGSYQLAEGTTTWGLKVVKWKTPFGVLNLKKSGLFTVKSFRRYAMLVLDPANIGTRTFEPTQYQTGPELRKGGEIGIDGMIGEWLTEERFEWHFPETMGYFEGVGLDGAA